MLLHECALCWLGSLLTLRVASSWEPDDQSIAVHLERWQNELMSLTVQIWYLKCLVSSWTPQSPYSLWVSSWIYWDLSFPELPCQELLLVTPGRVTHSQIAAPGVCWMFCWILQEPVEVQLHIRLCCFLFSCIVQGLLFLERFFFLAVPRPLWGVCCSFNLLLGFPIPFWHVGSGSVAA